MKLRRDWFCLLILLLPVIWLCCVAFMPEPFVDEREEPGKLCPVHGTALKEGKAPLTFSYPPWQLDEKLQPVYEQELQARASLFPCARSTRWYGCGVPMDHPKVARVSYCPDCRRAEADWKATHEHCIP